jgi:Fe-S oxidoreductase
VKKLAIGAVLVLTLAAAAGCGGGGGGTLSKEEYSAKLSKVCADLSAKTKEIGVPSSPDEVVAKGPQLAGQFQKAIDDAKKLKPPSELKDAADRFVSLNQRIHDKIEELIDAAKKQDAVKLARIAISIDTLSKESDGIATAELNASACKES